jgi:hypothetical protein
MNLDVLMIHEIVGSQEGTMYASISLLAKSLAFIISALEIVLLTRIAQSGTTRQFVLPGLAILATTALSIFVAYFFGGMVLQLMKPELVSQVHLLLGLLLLMGCYGVVSFYSQLLVLQGKAKVLVWIAGAIGIWYIAIITHSITGLRNYYYSLL